MTLRYMRYLATGLVTILLLLPALSVELFRYRGAAKDGGTLEYVFEAGEQNSPNAIQPQTADQKRSELNTRLENGSPEYPAKDSPLNGTNSSEPTPTYFRFLDRQDGYLDCERTSQALSFKDYSKILLEPVVSWE